MASRLEQIKILCTAEDKSAAVLSFVKKNILDIGSAYLAWRTVTNVIGSIIEKGRESEAVWNDVTAALTRHGHAVEGNLERIQHFADQMQTLSGISDEVIGKSVQGFIDYGQTVDEAMKTTRVAMDLAAGSGISLEAATQLLSKAAVGYTSMLSRYGIVIDENIPKSEKFAAAIEQITRRFGGAAAARADTFAVKMALLSERFGDFQEQLFEIFSPVFLGTVNAAINALGVFTGVIDFLFGPTESLTNETAVLVSTFEDAVNKVESLNAAFESGQIALKDYRKSISGVMKDEEEIVAAAASSIVDQIIKMSSSAHEARDSLFKAFRMGKIPADAWEEATRAVQGVFEQMAKMRKLEFHHWEYDWRALWQQRLIEGIEDAQTEIGQVIAGLLRQNVIYESLDALKADLINSFGFTADEVKIYFQDPLQAGLAKAQENLNQQPFQWRIMEPDFDPILDSVDHLHADMLNSVAETNRTWQSDYKTHLDTLATLDETQFQASLVGLDEYTAARMVIERNYEQQLKAIKADHMLSVEELMAVKIDLALLAAEEIAGIQTTADQSLSEKRTAALKKMSAEGRVVAIALEHAFENSMANMVSNVVADLKFLHTESNGIFKQMAADFGKYFVTSILEQLASKVVGAIGGSGILGILGKIFDTTANDRMAALQGQHFVQHFARGMNAEFGRQRLGSSLSGGGAAIAIGSAVPANQISNIRIDNITIAGNVSDIDSLVTQIERLSARGRSGIVVNKSLVTAEPAMALAER